MTHESERPYHDCVVAWLKEEYGEDNVETDKYLRETGRYCDVWIDGPLAVLAVEIENDWEAVLKGIGQAHLYAAHETAGAVPMVITPPGHVEEPEVTLLRLRGIHVREVDV